MDRSVLLEGIGLIYDASLDGDWSCVVAHLVRHLAANHIGMMVQKAGAPPLAIGVNQGLEPSYIEQYAPLNHAAPAMLRHTLLTPLTDAMLLDMEAHRGTVFFNEFLDPNGMTLLAGGAAYRDEQVAMGLSVGRGGEARPFGAADLAAIAALLPHLGRAFKVRQRLGLADQAVRARAEVLDRLSFAAFHVDAQGRVVEANGAADALLRGGDGLALAGGRLVASGAAENARLAAAIRSATRRSGFTLGPQEMLLLPRPSGRPALLVDVLPIPPGSLWDARPVCLLFVAEPDAAPQSAGQMLRELFGLTPSEVRLALLLGSGEGLAGLAERLGTRLATTRSHLAGALAKTGLHRQAELVRLVERCAAVSRRRV